MWPGHLWPLLDAVCVLQGQTRGLHISWALGSPKNLMMRSWDEARNVYGLEQIEKQANGGYLLDLKQGHLDLPAELTGEVRHPRWRRSGAHITMLPEA